MIHPTAIVEPGAQLGANVSIGPFSYIAAGVEIGDDCIIESHVVIKGPTRIGCNNHFYQYASIGEACQDKKYAGEATRLTIGDHNIFRECCTVHRGTVQDLSDTIIGSHNLFMAYTHIAHDCVVGDHNILANNATLAGHVHLGDWCILGGFVGVHQFCKIGSHSFCSISSVIVKDIPPYVMASGQPSVPRGINAEGLKRRDFDAESIRAIKQAYKALYRQGLLLDESVEKLKQLATDCAQVQPMIDFIEGSSRGIIR